MKFVRLLVFGCLVLAVLLTMMGCARTDTQVRRYECVETSTVIQQRYNYYYGYWYYTTEPVCVRYEWR